MEARRILCGDVPELVSAGLDGELGAAEASALDAHLSTCAGCSNLAARMEAMNRWVRLRPAEAVPDLTAAIVAAAPRPGRRRPVIAVAAAALAVVAGSILAVTIAGGPAQPALAVDTAVTPVPIGASGVAYLDITNRGTDDRLVGATSPVARTVELHRTAVDPGGRMLMAAADSMVCSAELALEPGVAHLMLVGIERPLRAGDRFPVVLEFERAGQVTVEVDVVEWSAFGDRLAIRADGQ